MSNRLLLASGCGEDSYLHKIPGVADEDLNFRNTLYNLQISELLAKYRTSFGLGGTHIL
jgi:hypothetical protein